MKVRHLLYIGLLLSLPTLCTAQVNAIQLRKAIYAIARGQVKLPPAPAPKIPGSLIQLYAPGQTQIMGSGFFLKHQNKVYAVFPHHLVNHTGYPWDIVFTDRSHQQHRLPITISMPHLSGKNVPDLSVVDLSEYALPPVETLELAAPAFDQPAYSFGYTRGTFEMEDFLPLKRHFLRENNFELITDRKVPMETAISPLFLSGYCGSPLLQLQNQSWKVVGMHLGSCVYPQEYFSQNHAKALNLSKALRFINSSISVPEGKRFIKLRTLKSQPLAADDQITYIEIRRRGESIFLTPVGPHVLPEQADVFLESKTHLQSGDVVIFIILQASGKEYLIQLVVP